MKRFGTILAILGMILLMSLTVFAEESLSLNIENSDIGIGEVSVYINSNQEFSTENLAITLGEEILPVTSMYTMAESEEGSTYQFIVDVSGSLKESQMTAIKEMLNGFVDNMGENDNASFMALGDELTTMPIVSDKDEMRAQIDLIEGSRQDTNLYAGIVQALEILDTNSAVKLKRNLIIISDGQDDYIEGYTEEEVIKEIEESDVPVSTIAMLEDGASDARVAASKVLSSFARMSAGGVSNTYGMGSTTEEIVNNIMTAQLNTKVVTASIVDTEYPDNKVLMQVALDIADVGSTSDEIYLNSSDITSSLAEAAEAAEEEDDSEDDGIPIFIFLIIGGVTFFIIVVTVVLMNSRKKKQLEANADVGVQPDLEAEKTVGPVTPASASADSESKVVHEEVTKSTQSEKQPKVTMTFTKLGKDTQTAKYLFESELVIGRKMTQSDIMFKGDPLLSGQHCSITMKNGNMYINDMGSTNGTFLNGIPVKYEVPLNQDDVILLGSVEVRVSWNNRFVFKETL